VRRRRARAADAGGPRGAVARGTGSTRRDPGSPARYDTFERQAPGEADGLPITDRAPVRLGSSPPGVAEGAPIAHSRRARHHRATRLGALEASAGPGGAVTLINGRRAVTPAEREGT